MKIAFIVTGGLHPSRREEVIPALMTFTERLAEEHAVHAFVLRHLSAPQQYKLGKAVVTDLGRPEGVWQQWRALMGALVASGPFDIAHGWWAVPAGLLATSAARRLRIASVATCDSGEFVDLPDIGYGLQRTWRGRMMVRRATRAATAVHVTSGYMESLARAHRVDTVRIPLGIVPWRRSNPIAPADGPPWRLVQVASLNPVKDQSTLLRALALTRQHLDVHLELVGEDTMKGALQREAQTLGISHVTTFRGVVPHDELPLILERAHLYVQSSRHEAAGIAVLEAALLGVPIVGTRVGYVCDWDGTAAASTPPGDAPALANTIIRLLGDSAARAALATASRERATLYGLDGTVERMTDLYRSIRRHP
jgi:glycosyltransferase involved in cell wall biosynthesis